VKPWNSIAAILLLKIERGNKNTAEKEKVKGGKIPKTKIKITIKKRKGHGKRKENEITSEYRKKNEVELKMEIQRKKKIQIEKTIKVEKS
jgi:hypothetical protein